MRQKSKRAHAFYYMRIYTRVLDFYLHAILILLFSSLFILAQHLYELNKLWFSSHCCNRYKHLEYSDSLHLFKWLSDGKWLCMCSSPTLLGRDSHHAFLWVMLLHDKENCTNTNSEVCKCLWWEWRFMIYAWLYASLLYVFIMSDCKWGRSKWGNLMKNMFGSLFS